DRGRLAAHLRRPPAPRRGRAAGRRPDARRDRRQAAGRLVSFAEPTLLAGFLLLPLAALAYAGLQRRRRRESTTWASPALVGGLVTARPGWRRHLPPLLLLLALGALILALA